MAGRGALEPMLSESAVPLEEPSAGGVEDGAAVVVVAVGV